jgi:REP element-mobilizing transposase RayT
MPNTYTQLYIHCVFAVKYRAALLSIDWDARLRSYITAIVQNKKHKMIAINNMPDHLHMFVGLHPSESISDMLKWVKSDSSEWVNKEKLTKSRFYWQEGYGAFSHSRSQLDSVVKYIVNQQMHHKKQTFKEEYLQMLRNFEVEYDDRYLFVEPISL